MFGKQLQLSPETMPMIEEIGKHMPGGFFIYQARQPETLLYANQAVFDIFGCDGIEDFKRLTGFTFKGMLHPEDYAAVSNSIIDQIATNEDNMDYVECRIVRKDGAVRWVDDFGHYVETEAYGGVYYVFISDITEKNARREKKHAMRGAVINTLTNAYNTVWLIEDVETEACSLFHTDQDRVHAEAIRNALSHARYTDTKTEYVATMVAKEDQERMQREISLPYILEQSAEKEQFSVSFVRALETGPRHYRIDFGKVYMPDGKTGVMMGFKDVDEETRQDLAIKEALEERLALQSRLLEQEKRRKEQDSMITAMASDYRSVYHVDLDANDAVCYRTDPNDPTKTPAGVHFPFHERFIEYCDLYVDKDYREGFLRFIDPDGIRAALANENIIAYRYLAHQGGKDYYEMLRMAGVRHPSDRDDHIVHAVGVGFTVIDAEMRQSLARSHALSEALTEAEQASKAKTAFLSNMSHEIRTPMNAIIGYTNLTKKEDISPTAREYLDKIETSSQHLLALINDILEMSRIENGRVELEFNPADLCAMLVEMRDLFSQQMADKNIDFSIHTKRWPKSPSWL